MSGITAPQHENRLSAESLAGRDAPAHSSPQPTNGADIDADIDADVECQPRADEAIAATESRMRALAEAALRDSERQFRGMIDALPAAVYTTDGQGRLTHFNPACIEFSGRTPEIGTDSWCVTWKLYHADGSPMPHDECPMATALKTGRANSGMEAIAERSDGSRIWFTAYPTPLLNDAGQVVGGINMLVDISARKRAEAALRESEERHAFLLRFSDLLRAETEIDAVADMAVRLLAGVLKVDRCYVVSINLAEDRADITHQFWRHGLPPAPDTLRLSDFPIALKQTFTKALVVNDSTDESALHDQDRQSLAAMGFGAMVGAVARRGLQRPIWGMVTVSTQPRHWSSGEITLVEDVAERTWLAIERTRAQVAMRTSEERYRELFDSIDDGFCVFEMIYDDTGRAVDYRFLEVNTAFEKHTGFFQAEGKTMLELVPNHEKFWFEMYAKVAASGEPMRFENRSEAMDRSFSIYAFRQGGPGSHKVAALFSDITERERGAEQLRQGEERLRLAQIAGHIGTTDCDVKTGQMICSPEFHAIYGLPLGMDVTLETLLGTVHPDDLASVEAGLRTSIREGVPFAKEFRILRANDGQERWVVKRALSIETARDRRRLFGANMDVTERRQAEEAARNGEIRMRAMFNQASAGVFETDANMRLIMVNRRWCAMLGCTEEHLLGRDLLDIVDAEFREDFARQLSAATTLDPAFETDLCLQRDAGDGIFATVAVSALHRPDGVYFGVVGVALDVTERNHMENALRDSEGRLQHLNEHLEQRIVERTRELADSEQRVRTTASKLTRAEQAERRRISQILHDDLQQQLHGMQMKLGMVRRRFNNGDVDGAMRGLDEVEIWAGEGVQIARRLTTDLSPPIMKSEGLTETLGWLVGEMRDKHSLEVEIVGDPRVDFADDDLRVLLFQIVRELLFNIVKHAGTDHARVDVEYADGGVVIKVSDAGRGFARDAGVEEKADGGFGLFSVRERLGLFGASMQIDSEPDAGTCITITVPPDKSNVLLGGQVTQGEC